MDFYLTGTSILSRKWDRGASGRCGHRHSTGVLWQCKATRKVKPLAPTPKPQESCRTLYARSSFRQC
ncbi:hypothetical protein J6590_069735 [Homalodisca vitripennis]|nr:hypothetical protein J6590_069735 [Homalodisca vitripennis]